VHPRASSVHGRIGFFFFFFQAEDGIRDRTVTGVQTCALPISVRRRAAAGSPHPPPAGPARARASPPPASARAPSRPGGAPTARRSEERRVGKEWRARRSAEE